MTAKPSYTVSIMEFRGDKVARETAILLRGSRVRANSRMSALNGSNGWTYNFESSQNAKQTSQFSHSVVR